MARHPEVPNLMESMRDECSSEWSRNFSAEIKHYRILGVNSQKNYRIEDFSSFANRVAWDFFLGAGKIALTGYDLSWKER